MKAVVLKDRRKAADGGGGTLWSKRCVLMPEVKRFEGEASGIVIRINYDLCNGAAACVDICPVDIYELDGDKAIAKDVDDCTECCLCVDACPEKAIKHSTC